MSSLRAPRPLVTSRSIPTSNSSLAAVPIRQKFTARQPRNHHRNRLRIGDRAVPNRSSGGDGLMTRRASRHPRRGFTLIEVLVTILFMAIVLPAVMQGIALSARVGHSASAAPKPQPSANPSSPRSLRTSPPASSRAETRPAISAATAPATAGNPRSRTGPRTAPARESRKSI